MTDRQSGNLVLYAAVGAVLTRWEVDADAPALTRREAITLPAAVQYAWPDRERRFLYVASSNASPMMASPSQDHFLSVLRIGPSGALQPHGPPVPLRQRPIHMTLDASCTHVLCVYSKPSGLSVHRIAADGSIGDEVPQPPLELGIYAHQVRVAPSDDLVVVVARGHEETASKPEDPGRISQFRYRDGRLGPALTVVAPNDGYGFGPRHIDFHPTRPWVFAALERQNEIGVWRLTADGLAGDPLFRKTTLAEPDNIRHRQMLGAIHAHPDGRIVYVSNRAEGTVDYAGKRVFKGGENAMAVFAIDPDSGEPTLLQQVETLGGMPRTFAFDPAGRVLVAANQWPILVRDGDAVTTVPASLALYRIEPDGRLGFVRKYDVETAGDVMFWMGMEPVPAR